MIVIRDVAAWPSDERPCVIALGDFDGVHRGHQAVLQHLTTSAQQSSHMSVVVSAVRRDVPLLGRLRQRIQRIGAHRVDVLFLVRPSSIPSRESLRTVIGELSAKRLIAGVVAGASDGWRTDTLWPRLRARVDAVPMVSIDGREVTSDATRAALAAGELAHAEQMLGARYTVGGHVVTGLRRGRTLGFPTANLRFRNVQLPPNGVYAVTVRIGAADHRGVANLGINPTFADARRGLETYIFDFDEDLYGRYIEVTFVAFLREERRFPNVDALVAQIRSDAAAARRLLS